MLLKNDVDMRSTCSLYLIEHCRWPVPMPYWRHRDYMDGDKSDDDDDGCEYAYQNGVKFMLF